RLPPLGVLLPRALRERPAARPLLGLLRGHDDARARAAGARDRGLARVRDALRRRSARPDPKRLQPFAPAAAPRRAAGARRRPRARAADASPRLRLELR